MRFALLMLTCFGFLSFSHVTGQEGFTDGPIIKGFGKVATVKSDVEIPEGFQFKIRFDVGVKARSGSINSSFDSVARLINLQARAGVPVKNMNIAVIVHGGASKDLLNEETYKSRLKEASGSAKAIKTLQSHGVKFYICGQSAAYHKIEKADLLPGVKVGWSAMTLHALLHKQDYSLNPF